MTKRRRPWKVFVHDIGPTFTFASAERAHAKAQEVMEAEHYAMITVYDASDTKLERTAYRFDQEPVVEEFRQVEVRGYGLIYQWTPVTVNAKETD